MRRAKVLLLSGCLGYEDLNDHDELCRDRLLALLCGRDDLTGQFRCLDSDRGKPLAGKSTLNRLELAPLEGREGEYKKIVVEPAAIAALLVTRYKVEVTYPDGGLGHSTARGNAHEEERNHLIIGPTNPGRSDPATKP